VCDHASRRIPERLGRLGLTEEALATHIAWDIGAAPLAIGLADRLDASVVLAGYSRLVIDCNRHLDDPTSILPASDGWTIPGNVVLDAAERRRRVEGCFLPYHRAIEEELAALAAPGAAPALVALHSFTPVMHGAARPWHCGILWDRDPRLPLPLIAGLRARGDLVVGDNEPYSGRHPADYTVDVHAERRGWPHVCIEVRQDELTDEAGVERWVTILADALEPLLGDAAIFRPLAGAAAATGAYA
jgi:predicted N-formylglutamate amidohydrolase